MYQIFPIHRLWGIASFVSAVWNWFGKFPRREGQRSSVKEVRAQKDDMKCPIHRGSCNKDCELSLNLNYHIVNHYSYISFNFR